MLRAGTAPENQAYRGKRTETRAKLCPTVGNSRRLGELDAIVSGRRRLDPFRHALQRVERRPVDLDRQDGVERRIELERSIAARVADDAGAFLDVVARLVCMTVDPDRNRRAHEMREVTRKARIEGRAPVSVVDAAGMREMMRDDDSRAGEFVRQSFADPGHLLDVHRSRMIGAEQNMGSITDDTEVAHAVPCIAHRTRNRLDIGAM